MLNPRQRYPANADAVCEELGRQGRIGACAASRCTRMIWPRLSLSLA
jgi:hypothetical protein